MQPLDAAELPPHQSVNVSLLSWLRTADFWRNRFISFSEICWEEVDEKIIFLVLFFSLTYSFFFFNFVLSRKWIFERHLFFFQQKSTQFTLSGVYILNTAPYTLQTLSPSGTAVRYYLSDGWLDRKLYHIKLNFASFFPVIGVLA